MFYAVLIPEISRIFSCFIFTANLHGVLSGCECLGSVCLWEVSARDPPRFVLKRTHERCTVSAPPARPRHHSGAADAAPEPMQLRCPTRT